MDKRQTGSTSCQVIPGRQWCGYKSGIPVLTDIPGADHLLVLAHNSYLLVGTETVLTMKKLTRSPLLLDKLDIHLSFTSASI